MCRHQMKSRLVPLLPKGPDTRQNRMWKVLPPIDEHLRYLELEFGTLPPQAVLE